MGMSMKSMKRCEESHGEPRRDLLAESHLAHPGVVSRGKQHYHRAIKAISTTSTPILYINAFIYRYNSIELYL